MNGSAPQIRGRGPHQIADELCELFQQQFDTLRRGLTEVELAPYLERRGQIYELQFAVRVKRLPAFI